MRLPELLQEGVYDPHIFKAVFTIGAPGSGKSTVTQNLFAGTGLRELDIDKIYEPFYINVPRGWRDEAFSAIERKLKVKKNLILDGRQGVILATTGRDMAKMRKDKQVLEELGYDTLAIYIHVDLNTALDRNETRRRRADPDYLRDTHETIQRNLPEIKNLFGFNFLTINNEDYDNWRNYIRPVNRFLRAPVTDPAAQEWIRKEQQAAQSAA